MSQLICPARTYVSSIPLHRRIVEVMKEKGPHYSQQAMAKRLGISRETFRHMLNGEREIYQFELEKIAKDLKVSVERLTQEDVANDVAELKRLFGDLSDNYRAAELADSFLECAIGETEKCDAHMLVGRIYFILRKYNIAHRHRFDAYSYALKLQDKYGETERLHEALKFLLTSYTFRKNYENAKILVDQVQEIFEVDPMRYGALCYTLAMIADSSGNFHEARSRFIQSLENYNKTGNLQEIGRAEHCVGFIEYKMRNYTESKQMFEKAILTLDRYSELQLTAIKDYVKVLFKLDDYTTAQKLIEESLHRLEVFDLPLLRIKFQLLASIANNVPNYAMIVLENEIAEREHKILACTILMNFYSSTDDSCSVMKYHRIVERLTRSDFDVMGEGDL